jgi:hypothetical protein
MIFVEEPVERTAAPAHLDCCARIECSQDAPNHPQRNTVEMAALDE